MRAPPLHLYRLKDYQILGVEQMNLHLLQVQSSPNKLLLKPLPEWILSHNFWTNHLCFASEKDLHASACGFILSYVWLITTPLDLKLAHEFSLLPSSITWTWWRSFVKDFLNEVDALTLHQVNQRYYFGGLRMDRITLIYRCRFATGYWYPDPRYIPFFERNFSWALIPFVFFSLILSAMQVGIDLDELKTNAVFLQAAYGMVMFSMAIPLALLSNVTIVPAYSLVMDLLVAKICAQYIQETRETRRSRIEEARVRRAA